MVLSKQCHRATYFEQPRFTDHPRKWPKQGSTGLPLRHMDRVIAVTLHSTIAVLEAQSYDLDGNLTGITTPINSPPTAPAPSGGPLVTNELARRARYNMITDDHGCVLGLVSTTGTPARLPHLRKGQENSRCSCSYRELRTRVGAVGVRLRRRTPTATVNSTRQGIGEGLERGLGLRPGLSVDRPRVTVVVQQALQSRHRAASDHAIDGAGVAPVPCEVPLEDLPTVGTQLSVDRAGVAPPSASTEPFSSWSGCVGG